MLRNLFTSSFTHLDQVRSWHARVFNFSQWIDIYTYIYYTKPTCLMSPKSNPLGTSWGLSKTVLDSFQWYVGAQRPTLFSTMVKLNITLFSIFSRIGSNGNHNTTIGGGYPIGMRSRLIDLILLISKHQILSKTNL